MRCRACNCNLSDFESTRRSAISGDYLDMCNRCLGPIVDSVDTTENFELFDPTQDDLTTPVYLGDDHPEDVLGAGPDQDEPEEDGFHPADTGG